ncbi:MAG: AraC family transcriptional regulator [Anaerolineae bacterium]|nr:AraC family transcriptional regulator [Anaerolineae bacterium]
MSLVYEERLSDSPYVELITQGRTIGSSSTVRPSEIHWHMVFVKHNDHLQPLVVGPLTTSGTVNFIEGVELLWIKFKLGTFMPHLPVKNFLDAETAMPDASSKSFWLKGSAWQFPSYENVDTFIDRLVHDDVLVCDPIVNAALQDALPETPSRTVRHRFLHATGLTQNHIHQFERAKYAATLLEQGVSILDTVHEAGYFDQPHLTRSLKRFIGKTPAQQLVRICEPE